MNAASKRQLWLDVYRGAAVAGMILVNNPGSWAHVYWPLAHANWHGATPADLVFPTFLFIVGVSIVYSLSPWKGSSRTDRIPYRRIVLRAAIIFVVGLLLAGFPSYDLATLRLTGVLQRIAICYLIAATLFVTTDWPAQTVAVIVILVGYWALMMFATVPGCSPDGLSKECNFSEYVDRMILGSRADAADPESLLGTFPAAATTICGVLAGHWLRANIGAVEKTVGLIAVGAGGILIGLAWDGWFPINKSLWTSSYVVFAAGAALVMLVFSFALSHAVVLPVPFQILGANALAAFVLAELAARIMTAGRWWNLHHVDGRDGASLQTFIYERLLSPWAGPKAASALYGLIILTGVIAVMAILHRRRIYLRA
jgi:predicted acyltransferase